MPPWVPFTTSCLCQHSLWKWASPQLTQSLRAKQSPGSPLSSTLDPKFSVPSFLRHPHNHSPLQPLPIALEALLLTGPKHPHSLSCFSVENVLLLNVENPPPSSGHFPLLTPSTTHHTLTNTGHSAPLSQTRTWWPPNITSIPPPLCHGHGGRRGRWIDTTTLTTVIDSGNLSQSANQHSLA